MYSYSDSRTLDASVRSTLARALRGKERKTSLTARPLASRTAPKLWPNTAPPIAPGMFPTMYPSAAPDTVPVARHTGTNASLVHGRSHDHVE